MVQRQDIDIYQGDDWAAEVYVTDDQGNVADLTGYTAKSEIRLYTADQSPDVLVEMGTSIDGPKGIITLTAQSIDTTKLVYDRYCWDIQVTDSIGVTVTLLTGYVNMYQEVTT